MWKYRRDSAMPFQTWNAFKPDDKVEAENAYGDKTIALARDLWWGYEEEVGRIGEGVIIKARLVGDTNDESNR